MIPKIESVTEDRSFFWIISAVSVMRMRELASGDDFDIFCDGSRRERMRFEGAGVGRAALNENEKGKTATDTTH